MSFDSQSTNLADPLSPYLSPYKRDSHLSVRLNDGRIMLFAGQIVGNDLANAKPADLFNPTTGQWSSAGPSADLSLSYHRLQASATVLQDGRVMLLGGIVSTNAAGLSATEIYNPTSNSWSLGPTMNHRRIDPAAVTMIDGRVLVVGGSVSKQLDLYDPTLNTWSLGPSSAIVRGSPSALNLADGRVLIAGGDGDCLDTTNAEIFDPTNDSIANVSAPALRKYGTSGVLLPDGRAFVAGLYYYTLVGSSCFYTSHDRAEIYNPANNTWFLTSQAPEVFSSAPFLLPNGKIFIMGTSGVLLYDIAGDSWTLTALDADFRRTSPSFTQTTDGNIVYAGGYSSNGYGWHRTAHIYDAQTGNWDFAAAHPDSPARARTFHQSIELADGRILVVGGEGDATGPLLLSELFDASSGTWEPAGSTAVARTYFGLLRLENGKVLLVGGEDPNSATIYSSAELFDPQTGQWGAVTSMSLQRTRAAFALLGNGQVIATGGYDGSWNYLDSTEIYNPATNAWSAGPALPQKRSEHSAYQTSSTKTVLIGGVDENWNPYNKAGVYDSTTNSWTESGPQIESRYEAPSVMLADGRILVAGGVDSGYNNFISSAEIFDPTSLSWSPAASLPIARGYFKMVVLSDGRVLGMGGQVGADWDYSSRIDIYDPAANTWTYVGEMNAARDGGHSVNRLGDGRVLVHGGSGLRGNLLHTSEYYGLPSINVFSLLGISSASEIEVLLGSGTLYDESGIFVPDSTSADGFEFLVTATDGDQKALRVIPE